MTVKLQQVYIKNMADNSEEYQTKVKIEAQMSLLSTLAGKLSHYIQIINHIIS